MTDMQFFRNQLTECVKEKYPLHVGENGGDASRLEQPFNVRSIAGDHDIAGIREQRNMAVDNISGSGSRQQFTDTAAGGSVDGNDVHSGKRPGQVRLTCTVAPGLRDDGGAGPDRYALAVGNPEQGTDTPVVVVDRDEPTAIEHDRHVSSRAGFCCR